jgi:hypothetical protein
MKLRFVFRVSRFSFSILVFRRSTIRTRTRFLFSSSRKFGALLLFVTRVVLFPFDVIVIFLVITFRCYHNKPDPPFLTDRLYRNI